MQHDVLSARRGVKDNYSDWVEQVCPCAANALVDMTYSLHEGAMAEFLTFNSLIEDGNWDRAALDLVTGTRWCFRNQAWCDRIVTLIKSCNVHQNTFGSYYYEQ